MDLNYCLNFESDRSFRRHNAEESMKSGWYVMEVVVVVVVVDVCVVTKLDKMESFIMPAGLEYEAVLGCLSERER